MSQYDSLISDFQQKLKFAPDFKKTVKFVISDENDDTIIIDASERPAIVTETDGDADVTLIAKFDTFKGLMNGTQDPNMAFMMRKLKIKGSMGIAMRLNSILED
jgi:putative sterol carrier protein